MVKGWLSEIFASFQGEGGTLPGSCFGKKQIFIRFRGCNLALGDFGAKGCVWCDSFNTHTLKYPKLNFEKNPGSQNMENLNNPIEVDKIISIVKNLITPDLHSISITGGEPLYQINFLINLLESLEKINKQIPLYLETNGSINLNGKILDSLGKNFTYCCCDIKDRSSKAAEPNLWQKLVEFELNFIKEMIYRNVNTFAKIVVTDETKLEDIKWISKKLSNIRYSDGEIVGLAIQPVFIDKNIKNHSKNISPISLSHLNEFFKVAANYLPAESLTLSVQVHKYLNLL